MRVLELAVVLIVAGRAIVVRAGLGTMMAPIVPGPAIAVLAVSIAVVVAETPRVLLLDPLALASLIPVVLIGSEQAGC